MPSAAVFHALVGAILLLAVCDAQASCDEKDTTCASSESPASLLQKDFRRDGKGAIGEEVLQPQVAPCTGTTMQGRCWHLSEVGESCGTTCAKYGRAFAYVVAAEDNPITPLLVGHKPQQKQEPWAALECYAPSEDRYHTANPNAAKHMVDDISAWKHESCKLACPCALTANPFSPTPPVAPPVTPPVPPEVPTPTSRSPPVSGDAECTWKQPPLCVSEFQYKGLTYHGCATVDSTHERPWCQHHFEHVESLEQDWSYCSYNCDTPPVTPAPQDQCSWVPAYSCVKEFDYEGKHYMGCTSVDHDTPWCSNDSPYKGSWNSCIYSCANQEDVVPPSTERLCRWIMKPECSTTFKYKGTDYTTCATEDHPTPWCSLDRIHKGDFTTCTKICDEASGHILPPGGQTTTSACETFAGDWSSPGYGKVSIVVSDSSVTAVIAGASYTGTMVGNTIQWQDGIMAGAISALTNCQLQTKQGENVMIWSRPAVQACDTFAGDWTNAEVGTISVTLSGSTAIGVLGDTTYTGTLVGSTIQWGGSMAGLISTLLNCQIVNNDGKIWVRPQAPVPVPPVVPTEEPCTRRPDATDDVVGNSATLDEAGYKLAASSDSLIDMKRFVCRVVDKIDCRVTNLQDMMAFVPYYSGLVSQQTYSHLHNELAELCHTDGKWVVPK